MERIIRRYVDRTAATKATIQQLNDAKRRIRLWNLPHYVCLRGKAVSHCIVGIIAHTSPEAHLYDEIIGTPMELVGRTGILGP